MAKISLHNDKVPSATYVSNRFIDDYMTAANGEYVKLYLYLLRCMNSKDASFSLSDAADKLEHTEKDVKRALKYWEKMQLLRLEYDDEKALSGIRFLDSEKASADTQAVPTNTEGNSAAIQTASAATEGDSADTQAVPTNTEGSSAAIQTASTDTAVAPKKRSYSAAEMNAFQEKESIRELLFVTEHYLKRPLTTTDLNTIFYWYDELKLSTDLMEYLIEYCVGKGHTSLRYMDKVALAWKDEGISTVEQAKRRSSAFSQLHFSVMRALGIQNRNLIAQETAYIDKWSKELGFSPDIITEACRRTITATHQPSFEYTDRILDSWSRQGIHHLTDIAKLDSERQNTRKTAATQNKAAAPNRFKNFNQRTYDYDELEQKLLKMK